MRDLILLIAVVVCPVVMGTLMLLMWRGMKSAHGGSRDDLEE
jgi:hypothetical protein